MRHQVLDHGYVELIESWGSDERIIEAARMSTGKGFLGWGGDCPRCVGRTVIVGQPDPYKDCDICKGTRKVSGDEKLLSFLWKNRHTTPFEMAGATIEIQAPTFVFREWHRHRTQSYNELSARYTPLPDVNYMPTIDRLMMVDPRNKQASAVAGSEGLSLDSALEWLSELADLYEHSERVYQSGLKRGVPKELARLAVTVGRYSRMRASANLRNWLGFLALRSSAKNPAAQWEIRQFADVVHAELGSAFPRTMELFNQN